MAAERSGGWNPGSYTGRSEYKLGEPAGDPVDRGEGVRGGNSDGELVTAIRFTNLAIAPYATIRSAHVSFAMGPNVRNGDFDMLVQGERASDAAALGVERYSWSSTSFSARARSFSSVIWSLPHESPPTGAELHSPDIAPILQEVVNMGSWSSGSAFVLFLSRRIPEAYGSYRVVDGTAANVVLVVSASSTAEPFETVEARLRFSTVLGRDVSRSRLKSRLAACVGISDVDITVKETRQERPPSPPPLPTPPPPMQPPGLPPPNPPMHPALCAPDPGCLNSVCEPPYDVAHNTCSLCMEGYYLTSDAQCGACDELPACLGQTICTAAGASECAEFEVTFQVSTEEECDAYPVYVCGTFNNWCGHFGWLPRPTDPGATYNDDAYYDVGFRLRPGGAAWLAVHYSQWALQCVSPPREQATVKCPKWWGLDNCEATHFGSWNVTRLAATPSTAHEYVYVMGSYDPGGGTEAAGEPILEGTTDGSGYDECEVTHTIRGRRGMSAQSAWHDMDPSPVPIGARGFQGPSSSGTAARVLPLHALNGCAPNHHTVWPLPYARFVVRADVSSMTTEDLRWTGSPWNSTEGRILFGHAYRGWTGQRPFGEQFYLSDPDGDRIFEREVYLLPGKRIKFEMIWEGGYAGSGGFEGQSCGGGFDRVPYDPAGYDTAANYPPRDYGERWLTVPSEPGNLNICWNNCDHFRLCDDCAAGSWWNATAERCAPCPRPAGCVDHVTCVANPSTSAPDEVQCGVSTADSCGNVERTVQFNFAVFGDSTAGLTNPRFALPRIDGSRITTAGCVGQPGCAETGTVNSTRCPSGETCHYYCRCLAAYELTEAEIDFRELHPHTSFVLAGYREWLDKERLYAPAFATSRMDAYVLAH